MRLICIVMLFAILGCQTHKEVAATILKKDSLGLTIPLRLSDYIKNNLPGWSIPDTSDYIRAWWSFYEKDQVPYFVTADFNDDMMADYALILKNSNSIRLIVFITIGNSFIHWTADNFEATYKEKVKDIQFGLAIEPPGLTECIVDNKERVLELKSNGIALMTLERKSIIYYMLNSEFKSFRVVTKYSDYTIK